MRLRSPKGGYRVYDATRTMGIKHPATFGHPHGVQKRKAGGLRGREMGGRGDWAFCARAMHGAMVKGGKGEGEKWACGAK